MEEEVPKKTSLWNLLSEESSMMERVLESEGEITPLIETALHESEESIQRKIDSYSFVMKRLSSESEFRKQEAEFHKSIQKKCERAIERMEDSLKQTMLFHSKKELRGHKTLFVLSKNAKPTIDLKEGVALGDVPERFQRIKTEVSLDKEAVHVEVKTGDPKVLEPYFSVIYKDRLIEKANTESKKQLK